MMKNDLSMELEYLNSIKKQFEYYKSVGEKTFDQLNEEDLFWQYNEHGLICLFKPYGIDLAQAHKLGERPEDRLHRALPLAL